MKRFTSNISDIDMKADEPVIIIYSYNVLQIISYSILMMKLDVQSEEVVVNCNFFYLDSNFATQVLAV